MAKTVTPNKTAAATKRAPARKPPKKKVRRTAAADKEPGAVDALLKLLESPLVADLLAVGATAALAAVTEHRSDRKTGADAGSRTVLKVVGMAAAAAIGRRLASEFTEIRKASKKD